MKKFYRTLFVLLGSLTCIVTIGLCLPASVVSGILPPTGTFPLHIFLASFTAAIAASLLWIGFSGGPGAVAGGAIDLAVFYAGLTICQLLSPQRLLVGVFLCSTAVVVSLIIFLRFHRSPIEDTRPTPLPVRISFGIFVVVLLLVGSALLLHVPNVFAWTLDPVSSALLGCFFLGSASYFLYGLLFPRWQNACGQLWSFLAYDLVLIVPYLLHLATVKSAQMPSLIVNAVILVYSAALAINYLLIKKETRIRLPAAQQSSPGNLPEWSKGFRNIGNHVHVR